MFQFPKPEKISKTLRLPEKLLGELATHAQNNGISVNEAMIQCCKYALENLESE